jgi:hypothetical protein
MTSGWNRWGDAAHPFAGIAPGDPAITRNALKKKRNIRSSLA